MGYRPIPCEAGFVIYDKELGQSNSTTPVTLPWSTRDPEVRNLIRQIPEICTRSHRISIHPSKTLETTLSLYKTHSLNSNWNPNVSSPNTSYRRRLIYPVLPISPHQLSTMRSQIYRFASRAAKSLLSASRSSALAVGAFSNISTVWIDRNPFFFFVDFRCSCLLNSARTRVLDPFRSHSQVFIRFLCFSWYFWCGYAML